MASNTRTQTRRAETPETEPVENARRNVGPQRTATVRKERNNPEVIDVNPDLVSDMFVISGNVGSDPELRFTPSGNAVCNFSVAVNIREKNGNHWIDKGTMWVRCIVWREQAERVAEYVNRGDRVVVMGEWIERDWKDDNDETQTVIEFQAREVGISLLFNGARADKGAVRSS